MKDVFKKDVLYKPEDIIRILDVNRNTVWHAILDGIIVPIKSNSNGVFFIGHELNSRLKKDKENKYFFE